MGSGALLARRHGTDKDSNLLFSFPICLARILISFGRFLKAEQRTRVTPAFRLTLDFEAFSFHALVGYW